MKKLFAMILSLSMILCLAACAPGGDIESQLKENETNSTNGGAVLQPGPVGPGPVAQYKVMDKVSFGFPCDLTDTEIDNFVKAFQNAMDGFASKVVECPVTANMDNEAIVAKLQSGELTCGFIQLAKVEDAPEGVTVLLMYKNEGFAFCVSDKDAQAIETASGMAEPHIQFQYATKDISSEEEVAPIFTKMGLTECEIIK